MTTSSTCLGRIDEVVGWLFTLVNHAHKTSGAPASSEILQRFSLELQGPCDQGCQEEALRVLTMKSLCSSRNDLHSTIFSLELSSGCS